MLKKIYLQLWQHWGDIRFFDTTDAKTFTIASGASYTVVNTVQTGNIADGASFAVTKTIRNNTSKASDGVVIAAAYDGSDNLLEAKIGDAKTLELSADVDLTVSFDALPSGVSCVRIFVWNNVSDALPLVAAQKIE